MKITMTAVAVLLFCGCTAQVHDYSAIDTTAWAIPRTDTLGYSLSGKTLTMIRRYGESKSASVAYPASLDFRDGTIEADMVWHGKSGGYLGLAFRIKDQGDIAVTRLVSCKVGREREYGIRLCRSQRQAGDGLFAA